MCSGIFWSRTVPLPAKGPPLSPSYHGWSARSSKILSACRGDDTLSVREKAFSLLGAVLTSATPTYLERSFSHVVYVWRNVVGAYCMAVLSATFSIPSKPRALLLPTAAVARSTLPRWWVEFPRPSYPSIHSSGLFSEKRVGTILSSRTGQDSDGIG